jgi:hypothetical protein
VLGQGTAIETIGSVSADQAESVKMSIRTKDISTSAVGSGTTASIVVGSVSGSSVSNDSLTITTGNLNASAIGIDSHASISIGEIDGASQINENVVTGNIYAHSISVSSPTPVEIGFVANGTVGGLKANINVRDISNEVNVAGGASSQIWIGNLLTATNAFSTIDVSAGNLSSSVSAALGTSNGVQLGNINVAGGGITTVGVGDVTVTAVACVSHLGCLSEIVGKKTCFMAGNIGLPDDCGNSSLIGDAVHEIEKLGEEVVHGVVVAAKAVAHAAESAWHWICHL